LLTSFASICGETNVARVGDKTIVIPGHGPIGDKSQLIEFRNMLVTIREKVAAFKKQGKSRDEVVVAVLTERSLIRR
jgi:hypothetical protein